MAYVSVDGQLLRRGDLGVRSFKTIWMSRPDTCQFAIIESPSGVFSVFDLFDAAYNTEEMQVYPGRSWAFKSEEAAITCAMMQL